MLDRMTSTIFDDDLAIFRDQVRRFFAREVVPNIGQYEAEGTVTRDLWRAFGAAGLLCPNIPEAYGGPGLDYRYNAVIDEELCYLGVGINTSLQSDITAGYIVEYGSEEQKRKWLPPMVTGEVVSAIAMTEPGTGSDLQGIRTAAIRDGDEYVINGSKTFITNGQLCDVVIVVARTTPYGGSKGLSLILVEADRAGFKRGRNLDKIGNHTSDTSELFFEDVRVPVSNCLGEEGRGFIYLVSQLPQERLSCAVGVQANAQRAFDITVDYVKQRNAFGQPLMNFQNTKFVLADLKAKLQIGWAHIDWALARHLKGELTTEEASVAKLWHTEMQWQVVDACLQLHGGHGYMNEMEIARLWRDARVMRIVAGTSEIMKEVIGRSL